WQPAQQATRGAWLQRQDHAERGHPDPRRQRPTAPAPSAGRPPTAYNRTTTARRVRFARPREPFMPPYTQDHRPLKITTPLGKDILLLVGLKGAEAVSQLFDFTLDALAENKTEVPFDRLLGQKVTAALTLADGKTQRYFSGICRSVAQGGRDLTFTTYRLVVVPPAWLL